MLCVRGILGSWTLKVEQSMHAHSLSSRLWFWLCPGGFWWRCRVDWNCHRSPDDFGKILRLNPVEVDWKGNPTRVHKCCLLLQT